MTSNQVSETVKTGLKLARLARAKLVPVLGAGTSISVGLPDWKSFAVAIGGVLPDDDGVSALQRLQEASDRLGTVDFIARVKEQLTLRSYATNLTIQALVAAELERIITVNLDTVIEDTFAAAGVPFKPSNVLCQLTAEDLSIFDDASIQGTRLLKLHGTIERPSTWVLRQSDYDRIYIETNSVLKVFENQKNTPLFIGYGFSDADIQYVMRTAAIRAKSPAYALIRVSQLESPRVQTSLKTAGIIPIPFYTFDQIPELLDEIFEIPPIQARIISDLSKEMIEVRVGALTAQVQASSDGMMRATRISKLLLNAVEPQPTQWTVEPEPRRVHGPKKAYLEQLAEIFKEGNSELALVVLKSLSRCHDVFLNVILPKLVTDDRFDPYRALLLMVEASEPQPSLRERILFEMKRYSLNEETPYKKRRAIIKVLAQSGRHSSVSLSYDVVQSGNLLVMTHHLTRFQVANLIEQKAEAAEIAQPYTVHSISEVEELINKASEASTLSWRLPTVDEWKSFAMPKGEKWPWGPHTPLQNVHAHLTFSGIQGDAEHPLEVTLFPGGSVNGMFDLIGNVYDLVTEGNEFRLAGGAWTTRYRASAGAVAVDDFRLIRSFTAAAFRNNIGLRLVRTVP